MHTDMFTADNLTIAELYATFDAAMMDVSIDDDGDLVVTDNRRVYLSTPLQRDMIRLWAIFGIKEGVDNESVHALSNRINHQFQIVRACLNGDDRLVVDWYLPVRGGIGKKTVVLAVRRFIDLLGSVAEHDHEDLMK
ncbi:MAG: YbjN domain-containing protein [Planctomycetia bacterium]